MLCKNTLRFSYSYAFKNIVTTGRIATIYMYMLESTYSHDSSSKYASCSVKCGQVLQPLAITLHKELFTTLHNRLACYCYCHCYCYCLPLDLKKSCKSLDGNFKLQRKSPSIISRIIN